MPALSPNAVRPSTNRSLNSGGGNVSNASHGVRISRPMRSGRLVTISWASAPPGSLATSVTSSRPSSSSTSAARFATPCGVSRERSGKGVVWEPSGSSGTRQRWPGRRSTTGSQIDPSTSSPCRKRTGGPLPLVSRSGMSTLATLVIPEIAAATMGRVKRLLILGSTGSIGTQALDVVARAGDLFELVGLSAGADHETLVKQAREHGVPRIALGDRNAAARAAEAWTDGEVLGGSEGLVQLVAESEADLVLNSIVGSAGLGPTIVALTEGMDVALANKESLVVGGELVTALAEATGARLIPIDSEHTALHHLLTGEPPGVVDKLVITASGGPFRGRKDLSGITVEEALNHPTWRMGGKITIDSATLMNKGLEVMEAHHLFGTPYDKIDVVVHPQSIIHAMVQLCDGSTKAHLGYPDMRVAIGYALHHPDRADLPIENLDLVKLGKLEFEAPDLDAFPCLRLAREAAVAGGTAPCALNAANEIAVHAFLTGRLTFTGIPRVIDGVLSQLGSRRVHSFDTLYVTDSEARRLATELVDSEVPA